ncbi:diguanylate cyclase [Massilia sp. R2A-15]|uniref:sensor domain-containing diguanylate cyclase n=1 Tax=Massilia sp. R2A-15 TaxID=3064278 RepID=UPI002733E5BF|nr:sensor domain-containing diguanylate cyclase [Massilia sp. R2A-15]WLI87918.1 diguanylate cyclase [Massilia sp. R2A-15]
MGSIDMIRPGMLENVLGALDLGAVVLDNARRVVLWNRWMALRSGCTEVEVLGRDFFAVFPELHGKRLDRAVLQALRDNFPAVLSQTLHKAPLPLFADHEARLGGLRIQQAVAVTPLDVEGGRRHCLIQVSDVSAAVQRERLLREQALELRSQTFSDGLTGIANRRHFDQAIEKEQRRAKRSGVPLSMLMIDIDFFKAYNDHYGHQQGDDTLIRVAAALAGRLKRPPDLIARYGGEEFAVILPDMDSAGATGIAETMRKCVAQLAIPHAGAQGAAQVTISIGVATQAPSNPLEVAELIGAADRALYEAKRGGRNRVAVDQAWGQVRRT